MLRKLVLRTLMVVALITPAAAQEQCVAPLAPMIPDGAKSTKAQITKALDEVKAFVAASDEYQACMLRQITTNQKEKERIGAEYGASARAFNAAQQQQQLSQPKPFMAPGSMATVPLRDFRSLLFPPQRPVDALSKFIRYNPARVSQRRIPYEAKESQAIPAPGFSPTRQGRLCV